jgi:predicted NBD/HSP70 family sugar kinase
VTAAPGGYREPDGPASQQGMRRANLALVLGAVARLGSASRAQLSESTGLTRAAVGSLVGDLIGAGLVRERGVSLDGRVGRPSTALVVSDRGPCGLGLDIGVEHFGACVVDLRHEVRVRIAWPAPRPGAEPAETLGLLAELARTALAEAAGHRLEPAGITVAVPGLVAPGGIVAHAPNLGWRDVDVAAELKPLLTGPLRALPADVENEANLGALAELWHGAVGRDFVHVSAGAGIGGAVVAGGMLLRGRQGFAGELGHMPVYPDGPACPCGARGCLEQYAGEEVVLRKCGLGDAPGDRLSLLAAAAAAGRPEVLQALEDAGRALGIVLAGTVNLVDPEKIIIGGAFAELAPWLTPGIQAELAARLRVRPWDPGGLAVSALRRDGPVIGAATSVVRRVISDPASLRR